MGIPGLWSALEPAAACTALPVHTYNAFSSNSNNLRGLIIGIDASIWLIHAQQSSAGHNPQLRLLFFRLAKLLALPLLPVFVFDGPNRPSWKRGKAIKGRQHALESQLSDLIEAFGFQWRRAKGEAEAELAYLNGIGDIDAVLTDDADTLLFGAKTLIRNWGKNLTGAKILARTDSNPSPFLDDDAGGPSSALVEHKLSGSDKNDLITVYSSEAILKHPDVGLDQDGMILIALFAGGDYDSTGVFRCGPKFAVGLARSGFGKTLVAAFRRCYPSSASVSTDSPAGLKFTAFVSTWLEEVRTELKTNAKGFLPSRRPKLAAELTDAFLSTDKAREILAYYVYPLTSKGDLHKPLTWTTSELDLPRLAHAAQVCFHWSIETVLTRFRSTVWRGAVIRSLRQEIRSYPIRTTPTILADTSPTRSSLPTRKATKTSLPSTGKITNFFTQAQPVQPRQMSSPSQPAATVTDADLSQSTPKSVLIQSITKQRRHASLDPYLEYQVQVDVQNLVALIKQGVDERLDAEILADRALLDDLEHEELQASDAESLIDSSEPRSPRKKRGEGIVRAAPEDPLVMWLPEPLLQLSSSGALPLAHFVAQHKRKQGAQTAAKNKAADSKARRMAKSDLQTQRGQKPLTDYLKSQAKPNLTTGAATYAKGSKNAAPKRLNTEAADGQETGDSDEDVIVVRPARRLLLPRGMQRALTSASTASTNRSTSRKGSWHRHTSLPSITASPLPPERVSEVQMEDQDSSIEFVSAAASSPVTNVCNHLEKQPQNPPRTAIVSELDTIPSGDGGPERRSQRVLQHLFELSSDDENDSNVTNSASKLRSPSPISVSRSTQKGTFQRRERVSLIDITSSSSEKE